MEFKEIVSSRRAANFFDPGRPVPQELLKSVVETALQSPSSFNFQPWSLVVLKDDEDKGRLRKLAMDQPKITEAPVVLMVLADRNSWKQGTSAFDLFTKRGLEAGMPEGQLDWIADAAAGLYGRSHEAIQAFACKNAGFFAMSLMYAAKDAGLESHPMDGFDHDAVKKEFSIPDKYWVIMLLALGYFNQSEEMPAPKWRKTYEEAVVSFK